MDIVSGHTSERLVVFRARPPSKRLGHVRVSKDQDLKEMIWDRYNCEGIYIGHVPAGCPFEAMVVEIRRNREALTISLATLALCIAMSRAVLHLDLNLMSFGSPSNLHLPLISFICRQ